MGTKGLDEYSTAISNVLFSKENIELGSVVVKTLDSKLNSSIDSLIKANIRKVKIYGELVAKEGEKLFCSAHTFDAYNRPLESYLYYRAEFVHILGVNG